MNEWDRRSFCAPTCRASCDSRHNSQFAPAPNMYVSTRTGSPVRVVFLHQLFASVRVTMERAARSLHVRSRERDTFRCPTPHATIYRGSPCRDASLTVPYELVLSVEG